MDTNAEFRNWIAWEASTRNWSLRELARHANMSHTMVAAVVAGEKKPSANFCSGIAKAFGLRADIVFSRAGLLPTRPERDLQTDHIVDLVMEMTSDERLMLLEVAQVMIRHSRRRKSGAGVQHDANAAKEEHG